MAVDLSAFKDVKKKKGGSVDLSAFGYEWTNYDMDGTQETTQIYNPDAVDRYGKQAAPSRNFLNDTEIAQAPRRSGVAGFINKLRDILPQPLSEGLFGTGRVYESGAADTGLVGFLYSGLTKTGQERFDDRVKKLTQSREVNGVLVPGLPSDRASEIAWKDILGEEQELLPREEKILASVGRWEFAEKALESLDAVPVLGGLMRRGAEPVLRKIAGSVDEILIGRELDNLLPKLEPELKAKAIPRLQAAKTTEEVQKELADIVQQSAKKTASEPRILRDIETKRPVTKEQVRERITPSVSRVTEGDPRILTLNRAAQQYKTFDAFVSKNTDEIYHATPAGVTGELKPSKEGAFGPGVYLTRNKDSAIRAAAEQSDGNVLDQNVYRVKILDDNLYKTTKEASELTPSDIEKIKSEGYSGVEGGGEIVVFDPANVVNEAQLKDIWNNVNTKLSPTEAVEFGGKRIPVNTRAPEEKVRVPEDELADIRDIVKRDQAALRPVQAVGKKDGRDLAKEVEANIRKYNAKLPDDEIRRIREENLLGEESVDDIILRKRGIITDAEAIERAKRIQGTLTDVINLPKGTAVTKEQRVAIEQIVAEEREINKRIRSLIDNGGISSTQSERNLLKKLGEGLEQMSDHEVLVRALEESTTNLKKAEIVLMGVTSEAGRTLQSANKVAQAVDTRLRVLWNKVNKNKKLDTLEKQALTETIIKMDTSDNKEFLKLLEELDKPDFFDKVAEWSVAAKLWNPTTHAVNLGGNTLRTLADMTIKTVTNPMAAKADVHGAMVGFKRGLKNAMRAFTDDGYAAMLSKYVETGGTAPAIGGKLGKFVRTPFRMLGAGDEIFKNMAYQRKLYRDAYAVAKKEGHKGKQLTTRMEELLNTPTFKMMEDATEEAKRMTFQEDMGEIMTRINRLRDPQAYSSNFGKGSAVGIRFFLPFLKTPTNLFKQTIDFSPLGLVKNWKELKKAAKEGNVEKVGTILGEAAVGSAIATYIAMETLDGKITGGAPRDPAGKDRFYREKKVPYAIKIGDTWYQYKRVDPFASIIGLTADMVTTEEKTAGALFGIVAENLKDKTYLSGVSDLMKVLTGEEWERDYALKSMVLGAAMPSFVGHITRSMDSNIRVADTIGQRLLVQTPGMSENFPSRVNVLGYDVERANKGLNYFFNPIQSESAKIDPVTQQLMVIDKSISVPQKTFQRDGTKYELTESEYEDFARFSGLKLRFELGELFKTPRYKNSDQDEKSAMIDTLRKEIQDEWKDEYVKERSLESTSKAQQIKNFIQGKPLDAPAEPEMGERVRNYFLGE